MSTGPVSARWSRRQGLWAVAGLLSGCGFRWRGAMVLPFATLATNLAPQGALGRELQRQLQASGVTWLSATALAAPDAPLPDVVLTVLTEQRERAVLGTTPNGQVREVQLRVRFRFGVRTGKGRDLLDTVELLQERDLGYEESLVLAKQQEEELLYREMQRDIVRALLYRLAALKLS